MNPLDLFNAFSFAQLEEIVKTTESPGYQWILAFLKLAENNLGENLAFSPATDRDLILLNEWRKLKQTIQFLNDVNNLAQKQLELKTPTQMESFEPKREVPPHPLNLNFKP
jgi:hypothetical protein